MKSLIAAIVLSLMVFSGVSTNAFAQTGTGTAPEGVASPPSVMPPGPGPGMMHGKGMMGHGPMAGCPGMPACVAAGMPCMGMGGGMGMGGMGMMDPKTRGEMMQIRGREMVEMGNLLIKHGKELEQQKPTTTPQ